MRTISLVTIGLLFFSAVSAQTISDCDAETAFGLVRTDTGHLLGDFCVNRDAGSMTGPISVSGLTLTVEGGENFTFEDLDGGTRDQMVIAPVITATYHNLGNEFDQSPEINVLTKEGYLTGFIYDGLATPTDLAPSYYVHVSGEVGGVVGLTGEAVFDGGTTVVELADNPQYGLTKETKGTISLTVAEDGTVSGFGGFSTKNIRSAGYSENEWVEMTVTIDELRGIATGSAGHVIKSYALVTSQVVDAEGDMREEKGAMEVFLFDPRMRDG